MRSVAEKTVSSDRQKRERLDSFRVEKGTPIDWGRRGGCEQKDGCFEEKVGFKYLGSRKKGGKSIERSPTYPLQEADVG